MAVESPLQNRTQVELNLTIATLTDRAQKLITTETAKNSGKRIVKDPKTQKILNIAEVKGNAEGWGVVATGKSMYDTVKEHLPDFTTTFTAEQQAALKGSGVLDDTGKLVENVTSEQRLQMVETILKEVQQN